MHIQFAELPVFDQDRAKAFYVEKLGCGVGADVPMGAADGWRWVELTLSGAQTALHFTRWRDEHPSQDPVMVLVDDDVPATVEALRGKGVEIITEPGPKRGSSVRNSRNVCHPSGTVATLDLLQCTRGRLPDGPAAPRGTDSAYGRLTIHQGTSHETPSNRPPDPPCSQHRQRRHAGL